ncbi:ankyrin repeat-containing domain protein, partial [Tuber borchii]
PSLLTAPDEYGNTPLHEAATHGHWPMVVGLLKRFITLGHKKYDDEINKKNHCGNTPLHLALQFDHPDIVQFLSENGADQSIKNN